MVIIHKRNRLTNSMIKFHERKNYIKDEDNKGNLVGFGYGHNK